MDPQSEKINNWSIIIQDSLTYNVSIDNESADMVSREKNQVCDMLVAIGMAINDAEKVVTGIVQSRNNSQSEYKKMFSSFKNSESIVEPPQHVSTTILESPHVEPPQHVSTTIIESPRVEPPKRKKTWIFKILSKFFNRCILQNGLESQGDPGG